MKKIKTAFIFLIVSLSVWAQSEIPYLKKTGTATQLIVEGEPFLMLGGELGNSTASSLAELDAVFLKLKKMGLNTVLLPAYWDLMEPEEGKYDFTLVDGAIERARKHDMKLVFLWFGVWKNSMSCYAPMWVKENTKKYPRAVTKSGEKLEILSAFSEYNLEIDKRVFAKFMEHIASVDGTENTVIMVQVENEIGMLKDARDWSPEANKQFKAQVPVQLTNYLKKNSLNLHPVLKKKWENHGSKTKGTWTELFGEGIETDEIFMAWSYGLFIQELIQAGKKAYNLPMYLNAALNSRERKPGQYPSAGPLAHLIDIWRSSAPAVDFISPDIYDPGFVNWCKQYHISGNPLFIPEIRLSDENAARVFYAFGEHDAMGFSPFSIEDTEDPENAPLTRSYKLLHQLAPFVKKIQGQGKTNGIWFDKTDNERIIERNGYSFTFKHDYTLGWSPNATDGSSWPESGAIFIELSPTEYMVAGTGVVLTFEKAGKNNSTVGIGYIDEIRIENEKLISVKRMNGDQNHQGRHLRIPAGDWSIQYVKLYEY